MEETYTHKCLKCTQEYTDTDPEPYLCSKCLNVKKSLAEEIDAKVGSTIGQKPQSDYQRYEELRQATGSNFVSAKELFS